LTTNSNPYVAVDIVALFIWFFGSGIWIAAGVGGGSIWGPLGFLLLRYDVLPSTGLSQWAIFGSAVAGFVLNIGATHPLGDRPLIDFQFVLFMGPLLTTGALTGLLIQEMIPPWMVLLLMVLVLSGLSLRIGFMAHKRRRIDEEVNRKMKDKGDEDSIDDEKEGKDMKCGSGARFTRLFWKSIGFVVVIWLGRLLFLFMQGTKHLHSFIPTLAYCSAPYWIVYVCGIAWLLSWSIFMGYRFSEESLTIEVPSTRKLCIVGLKCFASGIISAIIGVGGGAFIGPILLQLGVVPLASSATTSMMVLFSSSVIAIVTLVSSTIMWDVALSFWLAAFIGSLLGKYFIDAWMKKRNSTWVLVALLSLLPACGMTMATIAGLVRYSQKDWNFEGFLGVCEA